MGVDTVVLLPAHVRVQDVTDVIGKLLGHSSKLRDSGSVDVAQVNVENIEGLPDCVYLRGYHGKGDQRRPTFTFTYPFESDDGRRIIMRRSRAENIALFRRLVDFFGGSVDYQDCDAEDADYSVECPIDESAPTDGDAWYAFQKRIHVMTPLSEEEVAACEEFAAYHD